MQVMTITHKGKEQKLQFEGSMAKATTFLVIGPGFYGYGESLKVARENCIAAGCKRSQKMIAYLGDDALSVDDFGMISAGACLFKLGDV